MQRPCRRTPTDLRLEIARVVNRTWNTIPTTAKCAAGMTGGAMDFRPEHYFQAAIQRMRQALHLYQEGRSFALAIYVGGVAVECMLRAYMLRRGAPFDEKHYLLRLFAASGI